MKSVQSRDLPSALEKQDEIIRKLQQGKPAIFLDYDGTLTPIVNDPSDALLPERTKQLIRKLAENWTVAIMSGRALNDVKELVGLDNLAYGGSHGFNMVGPNGSFHEQPGSEFLPDLDAAEKEIRNEVKDLKGVRVERKRFAIAIHYRQAAEGIESELEKRVDKVAGHHSKLIKTTGKKIFELRPNADWDKGKALFHLLDKLEADSRQAVPLYIGDDTTDEDAFRAIAGRGIGILVTDQDRQTAADYVLHDTDEVADFLENLLTFSKKKST